MERSGQFKHYLIHFCHSKGGFPRHSYLKIYNFYYPDFFLFKMYLLFSHNEWKTQITKGSPFSFHLKKTTKGQVRLQLIILREGTGASFKTNTFLAE